MILPTTELRTWSRIMSNTVYTCSTNPNLIQFDALHAAFASDLIWWATDMPDEAIRTTVNHSLCLAIYADPAPASSPETSTPPETAGT